MRIEAVRRLLSKCWFNEIPTESGRDARLVITRQRDDTRNIASVRPMIGPRMPLMFGLMCTVTKSRAARRRSAGRRLS